MTKKQILDESEKLLNRANVPISEFMEDKVIQEEAKELKAVDRQLARNQSQKDAQTEDLNRIIALKLSEVNRRLKKGSVDTLALIHKFSLPA